ncbi:MAG: hypothetical protein ACK4RK_06105 [Gemmataceae bacterium]
METSYVSLATMDDLCRYVRRILCEHDNLDITQTPLFQAVIKRAGKPCGLFFQVQGPRLLRNYAIWAGEEDRILFYDATGERFAETRLSDAPDPRRLAA